MENVKSAVTAVMFVACVFLCNVMTFAGGEARAQAISSSSDAPDTGTTGTVAPTGGIKALAPKLPVPAECAVGLQQVLFVTGNDNYADYAGWVKPGKLNQILMSGWRVMSVSSVYSSSGASTVALAVVVLEKK